MDWFRELSPVMQALLATTGTWLATAAGAGVVVFAKKVSQRYLDASLGMAAGVMLAASFWSLLAPAIEISEARYGSAWKWFPPLAGFLLGAVALRVIDRVLPHLHPDLSVAEGPKTSWQRSTLLVLAITLHNIPEGLAVGVAFGAAPGMAAAAQTAGVAAGDPLMAALALAMGIGLQNFPEGTAVALPLRREGMSRARAFWYGQLSALVEPVAGVIGAALVLSMSAILPFALAFAAGAMVFVVAEELIPESQRHGNVDLATMGCVGGFSIMMVLDVALG
jgi:ZIP family zinc transporter